MSVSAKVILLVGHDETLVDTGGKSSIRIFSFSYLFS
jgi:hypothetical protein